MTARSLPNNVKRAIAATRRRGALVDALRAIWAPLMVLAGVGALGGLAVSLPSAVLSLIAGATLLVTAFLFVRAVQSYMPHGDIEAVAQLEARAGLVELAPLSSRGDRMIGGDQALWHWHQSQIEKSAQTLTKPVAPRLTQQDGLRGAALLIAAAVCVWQPLAAARILTFDLSPLVGDGDLVSDVWAVPPAYTGLPLVRLDRTTPTVSLPVGSMIHARLDGARGSPRLIVPAQSITMARDRGEAWMGQAVLTGSGRIHVDRLGSRAMWQVTAITDKPPVLSNAAPITIDPKGRLDVAFSATDDYAITSASLLITAIDPPPSMASKVRFETPIQLSDSGDPEGGEEGARRVFVDVSQHVLTGLDVSVSLVVRDGAGQETKSAPTRLRMPQMSWKTALGAALQEQRLLVLREGRPYQSVIKPHVQLFDSAAGLPIALDLSQPHEGAPPNITRAMRLLSATLSSLRETGLSEAGIMGMQFVHERLMLARHLDDAREVAPVLWELALRAEASQQSPAQQKLAAAQQALEEALKNGATEQQIRELSQELREAVGERLQELAQEGGGQSQGQGEGANGAGSGSGGEVSSSEIDKMLSDLEQSGSAGARQDALDQLAQLNELMDNLQSGASNGGSGASGQQSDNGQNNNGQSGGQNPLDEAMRAQRDLSDETAGRNNNEAPQNLEDLAARQESLANQLAPRASNPSPPANGEGPQGPAGQLDAAQQQAAQAMRQAARALRDGDIGTAQEAQAQAEQALQQAAQAQSAQNGTGGNGDTDPLGRPLPRLDDGRATKVPDQTEKRRARDVREELRRRQADPARDGQERDYLDRLLKEQ